MRWGLLLLLACNNPRECRPEECATPSAIVVRGDLGPLRASVTVTATYEGRAYSNRCKLDAVGPARCDTASAGVAVALGAESGGRITEVRVLITKMAPRVSLAVQDSGGGAVVPSMTVDAAYKQYAERVGDCVCDYGEAEITLP